MSMKFRYLVVLLTVGLTACQSSRHQAESPPPPQDVTPGSTFTVVKDFLVPSGDSSVYFQDARLYPQGEVQPNYPYCEFITAAPSADGQVIKGTYMVSSVEYDENGVGLRGIDVAITVIHLQASSSGEPYRMNCMLPLLSRGARFVTPAEVQGAVGGYMDLSVAP
jgi:hypothetical protein